MRINLKLLGRNVFSSVDELLPETAEGNHFFEVSIKLQRGGSSPVALTILHF